MASDQEQQSLISTIANTFLPSEAEASPIGKEFMETAARKAPTEISSAAKRLVGSMFKGKTITEVTKGSGQWRYLKLADESVVPVTKDVINDLSRAVGTKTYTAALKDKSGESQLVQAMKSLEYHRARRVNYGPTPLVTDQFKRYEAQLGQASVDAPQTSLVQHNGERFSMPTEYATMLEKEGLLKIIRQLNKAKK